MYFRGGVACLARYSGFAGGNSNLQAWTESARIFESPADHDCDVRHLGYR
jgi:hypothetical protein